MADAEVKRLHLASVAWRKTRIAALLQTAVSFDLVARLRQMPPTRVLDMATQNALLRGLMGIKSAEHARAAK